MKQCNTCKQTKPLTDFYSTGRTKSTGNVVRKPDCKICHDIKWKQRKLDQITEILGELKCTVCGYNRCKEALEFHHLDPKHKDFSISSRVSISKETLNKELSKCVCLCANCHREVHVGLIELGPW